jgi:hypothetical protein
MGVLDLLLGPAWAPLRGVIWLGQQIAEQADHEMYGKEAVQQRLTQLAVALDLGEISEEDYEEQEEALLARLRELRGEAEEDGE